MWEIALVGAHTRYGVRDRLVFVWAVPRHDDVGRQCGEVLQALPHQGLVSPAREEVGLKVGALGGRVGAGELLRARRRCTGHPRSARGMRLFCPVVWPGVDTGIGAPAGRVVRRRAPGRRWGSTSWRAEGRPEESGLPTNDSGPSRALLQHLARADLLDVVAVGVRHLGGAGEDNGCVLGEKGRDAAHVVEVGVSQ